MKKLFIVAIFCGLKLLKGSLIEFKICQLKFNCTENLTPADCPQGQFLDPQLINGCCHGCRSGMGWYMYAICTSYKLRKTFLKVAEKVAAAQRERTIYVHLASSAMKIFIAFLIEVCARQILTFHSSSSCFYLSLSASCLHSMHFDDAIGWKPNCEIDGSYVARQCRGDKLTGR